MDAGRAVIEDDDVTRGEEILLQEFAQGNVRCLVVVIDRGDQVADVAVEDELVEGLGEVFARKLFGPSRIMRGVAFERAGCCRSRGFLGGALRLGGFLDGVGCFGRLRRCFGRRAFGSIVGLRALGGAVGLRLRLLGFSVGFRLIGHVLDVCLLRGGILLVCHVEWGVSNENCC